MSAFVNSVASSLSGRRISFGIQQNACQQRPLSIFSEASTYKAENGQVLKPTGSILLIKKEESSNKTTGGILLPDTAVDEGGPAIGKVVAAGPGRNEKQADGTEKFVATTVKAGDKVMFAGYYGKDFDFGKDKLFFISENNVLAVVG
mmetsp:Transcript_22953/g.39363  ORF Transcript_22953/g.39363 Transcript_22953/m.39363 type:complete len:147 (-) Transcript_22953:406-846(-)|eukprot:CAMPEP_0196656210 /NCGR_PEP_ID=MMETSP1086-20130531/13910_1 /TAXON_ID=77921 /ORGANISM="Cyanoptyche  gloeocystis , Strain SAG4.97" /LENGTH=146 /DNA_ID=CAMNT_0041988855 /DNA_START=58 /DNA_END=498 /DNA_ORIENTATION=+